MLGAAKPILFSSARAFLGLVPGLLALVALVLFGGRNAVDAILPALAVLPAGLFSAWLGFAVAGLMRLGPNAKLGLGALFLLVTWVGGPHLEMFGADARAWILPAALALALVLAGFLVSAVSSFLKRLSKHLPESFFGVCSGLEQPAGKGDPALTSWMHEHIQALAGRGESDDPLTFGDLKGLDQPIDLRSMTTCITRGRPYLMPFNRQDLFFHPDELRRLLPEDVVKYMVKKGEEVNADPTRSVRSRAMSRAMSPRLPLPAAGDLPILLAARMSLSFPFLLSAVPFWSFDWRDKVNGKAGAVWRSWGGKQPEEVLSRIVYPEAELPDEPAERYKPEVLWFSDGGLCGNFPVHLFDQIPKWPTFAINLRYHKRAIKPRERVEMVNSYSEGKNPVWTRLAEAGDTSPGGLARFAGSLIGVMQNWVDNSLTMVPGYTDRIVHVNLGPGEGGLNLEMTPEQIEALAERGELAAEMLVRRFHNPGPREHMTWDAHRWTRLRSTLGLLQTQLQGLQDAYSTRGPESPNDWSFLINRAIKQSPYKWKSPEQAALAATVLKEISSVLETIDKAPMGFDDEGVPKPRPELKLRPSL